MDRKELYLLRKFIILFLIILPIIVLVYLFKVTKARKSMYRYDVSQNYMYDMNESKANIINLESKDGKIRLGKNDYSKSSTFLKVSIETTLMGKYFQPSIELKVGETSFTQYFEYGAKGIRYLNISSLLTKNTHSIELIYKKRHIILEPNNIQLISFKNKDISKLKTLVLAPHPDDAEIAAYGLYSDNNLSHIITITAGESGEFTYDEIYSDDRIKHYIKKGKLRTFDSVTVPMLGNIPYNQILNFGYFDRKMTEMYRNKSKIVRGYDTNISDINIFRQINISPLKKQLIGVSNWNSLVNNLKTMLKVIKPSIIVAPYPALDTHPDHKLTTVALFEALKSLDIREGDLYLYTNHSLLSEHYPYGNSGGIVSLPPILTNKVYFDSIYSHALSEEKQQDKIFALDAMHDLRLDTEYRFTQGLLKLTWKKIQSYIYGTDYSYFRRSIRSNELFFIVNIKHIYNKNIEKSIIGNIE